MPYGHNPTIVFYVRQIIQVYVYDVILAQGDVFLYYSKSHKPNDVIWYSGAML